VTAPPSAKRTPNSYHRLSRSDEKEMRIGVTRCLPRLPTRRQRPARRPTQSL
jgi:hypothetical protein